MQWTDEKVEFIKQYFDRTDEVIAKLFNKKFNENKTSEDIKMCRLHYIGKKHKYHVYSEEEIDFLRKHLDLPRQELVDLFNKTFNLKQKRVNINAIIQKKILTNKRKRHEWTEEEIKFVINHNRENLVDDFNKTFNLNLSYNAIMQAFYKYSKLYQR